MYELVSASSMWHFADLMNMFSLLPILNTAQRKRIMNRIFMENTSVLLIYFSNILFYLCEKNRFGLKKSE